VVLGKGGGRRVLGPDAHVPHFHRIGNLLVPNDNYCKFEDWLMPILDQMVLEQNTEVGQERPGGRRGRSREALQAEVQCLLLGCEVDTFQDDCPPGQGDQQPRISVLLGPEGEGLGGARIPGLGTY